MYIILHRLLLLAVCIVYLDANIIQDGKEGTKTNITDVNVTNITDVNVTNITCVKYNGNACQQYLKSYQSCLYKDDLPNVFIPASVNQAAGEYQAELLMQASDVFASAECGQVLIPVACLYLFPLCDKNTNKMVRPTYRQCEDIKNNACSNEWKKAESVGFGDKLPKCDTLPNISPPLASNCCEYQHRLCTLFVMYLN